jgi:O-antigen ligase
MRALEYERTKAVPLVIQAGLAVLCGLALARLLPQAPMPVVAAAVVGLGYCIVFLQRPDLGLLSLLILRSSSDLTIWMFGIVRDVSVVGLTVNSGLILILVVCGGVYVLSRSVPVLSLPGGVLLFLLQVGGLVALLRSPSLAASMNEWLAITSTIVAYALAACLFRNAPQIQRVIDALAISFVVPAIFGLWELANHMFTGYRVRATFETAPAFAMYLVLILTVFVGQFLGQSGMRKLLGAVIAGTSGILLIATYTRGAWAGALAALFVITMLGKRVGLALALIAVVLVALAVPSINARVSDVSEGTSTLVDRTFLWQFTIDEWKAATEEPGSSFATAVNRLAGLGPMAQPLVTGRSAYGENIAHNDYLRIAVNYGIFGLIMYVLLMFVVTVFAYRTWRQRTDERLGAVAMSFVALSIGYSIFSLTDNLVGKTHVQVAFWVLAGLTVALARLQAHEKARRPAT